jgi:hypothetical protein
VTPRLDSFQRGVLNAFFRRESRFFLTGGAALAGFHLGHRETKHLDLFTTGDFLEDGVTALREAANELAASIEAIRTAPDFRRFLLRRGTESVIVDLVRDTAPQLFPEKPVMGTVRIDPVEEILANKLCALLARGEIRDLVDVRALERAGLRVEDLVGPAARKDGGLTPGQLAWVLSQIEIGEDAVPPGGVTAAELRLYLRDLERRLTALALPR